jgi:tetratricopeptide (TPR) repeat protein
MLSIISTLYYNKKLADIYEKLGWYENAIPHLQKNIDYARSYGGKHPVELLRTISRLARLLRKRDRYSDAVPLYEECLHGFLETYGLLPTEVWTAQAIEGLGICYEELGRYEDAVALMKRNVEDARRYGYKPNGTFPWLIAKLARFLLKAGRPYEAVTVYEECFPIVAEQHGLTSDWTLIVMEELGICYGELGRYDEIFALFRRVSDQIRSIEGEEHPAFMQISELADDFRNMLAARNRKIDESQGDSDRMETSPVKKPLVGDGDMILQNRPAGEDWMGELFDFDLLENRPS